MEYKHDKKEVAALIEENVKLLERSRIMERFLQRKNITQKGYDIALSGEQKKIKMYEEMLDFLHELEKE